MYYGRFHEVPPGAVKPKGHILSFLQRQNQGLSSNYTEQGYPFDTPMWNGGVGKIILASVIAHDQAAATPLQESWWPYEQSAYLLDGLLRLGLLLDDPGKIALFEENLKYMLSHPNKNGLLGHCYNDSPSEWPMAVFFRAACVYHEATGNARVKEAFHTHYSNLTADDLAVGFRHINNLEGLLKVYEWTSDPKLLAKALKAYYKHDERNNMRTDDEYELHWSRITSGRNYVIHGVSFSESIKLPVLLYLYTGDFKWLKGAEKGLREVLERHEQITGLPSCNEDFAGRDPLQGYETCVISDFSWTLGYFLMASGDSAYADRIEKIFFNALPGSLSKDFTALQYLAAPNQTIAADFSNNSFFYRGSATFRQFRANHSAQCCPGNVHRAMPNYILRQWMLDSENGPVAALYGPSVFSGVFNGTAYVIEEETEYPYSEMISFRLKLKSELNMPFTFRVPAWCSTPEVKLNDDAYSMELVPGKYASLTRVWKNNDVFTLKLPMKPVQKTDRYWSWFEMGPLVFSYPISFTEQREDGGSFCPRNFYPSGTWNYGVAPNTPVEVVRGETSGFILESPPVKLKIQTFPVSGFDNLDQNRYTPEIPLFCEQKGEKHELILEPYASTILRLTAFPDAVKRITLPVYQVLATKPYPYDDSRPLSEQCFLPEQLTVQELLEQSQEMQADLSGYYDLLHHFGKLENVLSYVMFRFWSDNEGLAIFAVRASDGAECFVNGKKQYIIEPVTDGEFMAPFLFEAPVKCGWNILMLKVCEGFTPAQYRRSWGAGAQVFFENL
jgi:hypothetical protein